MSQYATDPFYEVRKGWETQAGPPGQSLYTPPMDICELVAKFPEMRAPVIDGVLRRGEIANIVAPSKRGKSWMIAGLAVSVAMGYDWLGTFKVPKPGRVLVLDNELHGETLAYRIPKVASALGVSTEELRGRLFVESQRGQIITLESVTRHAKWAKDNGIDLVVVDAMYRLATGGVSENDNAAMAALYGRLDEFASVSEVSMALIHHSSKGNQAEKDITDVGAGAGSQARAADVHAILREHEEPGVVVLEAAVRSWAPVEPVCLRWKFPLWHREPTLDPTKLKGKRGRPARSEAEDEWRVEDFVAAFVTEDPRGKTLIIEDAVKRGLSKREAANLLLMAEEDGQVFRHQHGRNTPARFATVKPPEKEATSGKH